MNTLRTKPPVRWNIKAFLKGMKKLDGQYTFVLIDPKFNQCIGEIITKWPHVEEQMVGIFSELLGVVEHQVPMRQVFRSITSQHTRLKIMRNLLEDTSQNSQKGLEYDQIIDEFSSLNDKRNEYAHGIWSTHESGKVFLSDVGGERYFSTETREIKIKELQSVLERMQKFEVKTRTFAREEMIKRVQHDALSQKRRAQRDENSKSALPTRQSEGQEPHPQQKSSGQ